MKSLLAPPERPLTDGVVALRLPAVCDVASIAEHTHTFRGLDGCWLPVAADAPAERHRWIVNDWLRAWANLDSYHGPALLVTAADAAGFVGRIGFGARAGGVVELDYGIAPR